MRILIIVTTFIAFSFSAVCTAQVYSPYHFSAEVSEYPATVNGALVREFIDFDSLSGDVAFINDKTLAPAAVAAVMKNRALGAVPKKVNVRFGYTLRTVNMTMLPSGDTFHKGKPEFDSNQYTRLGASAPVAILHESLDKKFIFVQADCMRGWIPSDAVNIYDINEFRRISALPYVRVVKDGAQIGGTLYNIGDKIPVTSVRQSSYALMMPDKRRAVVKKGGAVIEGDSVYSEDSIKKLADSILGDPYDWGGKRGFRDCSSFVRDLWLVFGVDLPRNTSLQVQTGEVLIENPKSKDDFFAVLEKAVPFKTLIFFKGHVLMFGGFENGDHVVYHSVNRLAHDNGTVEEIASVVRQNLVADGFTDIWKRVTKVIKIN